MGGTRNRPSVRVYVCSVPGDMDRERDLLTKRVFPYLREACTKRDTTFVDIDLRWGITPEQAERGGTVPIYLKEIEECQWFLCLMGQRYGWYVPESELPPSYRPDAENDQGGNTQVSLTELEINHAAFSETKPGGTPRRCFFYTRADSYVDTVSEDEQEGHIEDNQEAYSRQVALKERIRVASDVQDNLSFHGDYTDVEAICDQILKDLETALEELYPAREVSDYLEYEANLHEAFAESRSRNYVPRQAINDILADNLEYIGMMQRPPLMVTGESGSGKSSLLANFFMSATAEPMCDFTFVHFIGASAESANLCHLLRRLYGELKRHFSLELQIPNDPDALRSEFPLWLEQAATRGSIVIVLDALNQLEDRDQALHLEWLPREYPNNVRVVVSTLRDSQCYDALEDTCKVLKVSPLELSEREALIQQYLSSFSKRLSYDHVQRIVQAPQTRNPLYLRLLLQELRVLGEYEELDERIDEYLQAETVPDLYDLVLSRLEADYDPPHPGLVRSTMTLLYAARRGLSETELTGIMKVPRAIWSPLYFSVKSSLVNRSGLLNFFHDYFRQGVQKRYLPNKDELPVVRHRIADYCIEQVMNNVITTRTVEELPWQLQKAYDCRTLKQVLTNLDVFLHLFTQENKFDLFRYWQTVGRDEAPSAYITALSDSADQYGEDRPSQENRVRIVTQVALFLREFGYYERSEPLFEEAYELSRSLYGDKDEKTGTAIHNLSLVKGNQGKLDGPKGAKRLRKQALKIFEHALGKHDPKVANSLYALADVYYVQKKYPKAEPLYIRAMQIREKVFPEDHPLIAQSLAGLGLIYDATKRYEESEQFYLRALNIRKKLLGPNHPDVARVCVNLGAMYKNLGDLKRAIPYYEQALAIRENALGPTHPYTVRIQQNLDKARSQQERLQRVAGMTGVNGSGATNR